MKTLPPQLTPFVRSDAVGAILAETLGHPEEEFSLAELGRRTAVSGPVVHREAGRLVESEVLHDRAQGRNRLVRANTDHPLFALMSALIDATYGPVPALREAFADVAGAEQVLVYGSWAARRAGEPGPHPGDIDVLLVGSTPRRALTQIGTTVGERIGIPVNITRLSGDDWDADDATPFVRTLRSRPLVDVMTGEVHA